MKVESRYHWLVAPGKIEQREERYDAAALKEGELLCRTRYSAISPGTELAAFSGQPPLRPTASAYPRWLGYMNVAEVLASRSPFVPGTLVYTHAAHRSHYVIPGEKVLAQIPSGMEARSASVAYLYRLAWTGLRRGRGRIEGRIGVVGVGAIGLCAVQLARTFGCEVLAVSDHASASAHGAQVYDRPGAEARFAELPEAEGCDLVLVTTNAWRDWDIALSMTRFGAVVSVIGFPGRGGEAPARNPLASRYFYDRQLSLMSAGKAGPAAGDGREAPEAEKRDLAEILGWIASGRLDARALVAGVHPASDLAGAYRRLQERGRKPGTVVLDWSA